MDELEASVRITEAVLARIPLGGSLEVGERTSNGTEVGKRIGELFIAIHRAVKVRNETQE